MHKPAHSTLRLGWRHIASQADMHKRQYRCTYWRCSVCAMAPGLHCKPATPLFLHALHTDNCSVEARRR